MAAQSYTQVPTLTRQDLAQFIRTRHHADSWVTLFQKYGNIIALAPQKKLFVLCDPAAIAHVLKNSEEKYDKNFSFYHRMKFLLGDGLLTRTGETWAARRKCIQPHFSAHVMSEVARISIEKTQAMMARWQRYARTREVVHLNQELLALVLQIASQALLHTGFDDKRSTSLVKNFARAHRHIRRALSLHPYVPSVSQWLGRWQLSKVKTEVKKILKQHQPSTPGDMADTLLWQQHCPVHPLTQQDIEEEVRTFLGAGHETTASSLLWTILNLLQHPCYLADVQQELSSVFAGRELRYEDISSLVVTKMALQESLRLYPPIWMTGRRLLQTDEFAGYTLPTGSTIFLCLYALHRDTRFWSHPEIFNPYRFTRDAIQARDKQAYLPFGAGGHVCIAQLFAMTQMHVIVALLLQRFDLELLSSDMSQELLFTIHPKHPIYVRVKER